MAKKIINWLNEDVEKLGNNIAKISELYFHRDPTIPQIVDPNFIFSPASGIILYQKEVLPNKKIVEVKGKNFTLQNLLNIENFNEKCLVIGIFMTMYDIHINRIPYSGFVEYTKLDTIGTHNKPMLDLEKEILEKENILFNKCDYLFYNERVLNTIYIPKLNYRYYLVQIADKDIDVISHFYASGEFILQNSRFSVIRYGSQVDLVFPIPMPFKYKLLIPNNYHVEVGKDRLIRLQMKPQYQQLHY